MEKIHKTVFAVFIKDNKLLTVKSVRSAKQNMYTLVGGSVEEDETILEAAVRECKEEINENLEIKQLDFIELFNFIEPAASDPNLLIDITILLYKKELDIELKPDLEIIDYNWVSCDEENYNFSSTITDYVFPWMRDNIK